MRTGRPPLPLGVLGDIRVDKQVQDGKHASGNLRWRNSTPEDENTRVRWVAVATYRDRTGKRRVLRKYSSKSGAVAKRDLQAAWADILERDNLGRPSSRGTFTKLALAWWTEFETSAKIRPQTKRQYSNSLHDHVIPTFGDLRVYEVDSKTIFDGLEQLASGAPTRARFARVVLKHVCDYAVRSGVMSANPVTRAIPTYKPAAKAPEAISPEDYREVRQAILAWQNASPPNVPRANYVLDVTDFMMGTGCRIGEALAVRWEDVDLGDNPSVTFSGTIVEPVAGKPTHRQNFTKTAAGFRKVPIGPSTHALLLRRAAMDSPNDHNMVFPNMRGGYLAPNNYRHKLRTALQAADLDQFFPHLARKTGARNIRDKAGIEAASAVLGHSSTAVTTKHYAGIVHDAPNVSDVMETFIREATAE